MFLTPSAEGWSVRLTELECRQNIWGTSKHMGNIKIYGEHQNIWGTSKHMGNIK